MAHITIRSRVARPLSFALPHRPCCIALGRCRCRAGVPPTVQICQPYGLARGVEETDLGAPDFVRAIRAQEIVVLRAKAAPMAAPRVAVPYAAATEPEPFEPSAEARASRPSGGSRRRSS